MNRQSFLNLLKDSKNLTFQDLHGLEEVIANFPYCQAAHLLAAKGAHDNGRMHSEKKIRVAAAYASERKILKELILQKPLEKQPNEEIIPRKEVQPTDLPYKEKIQAAVSPSDNEEKADRIEDKKAREIDTVSKDAQETNLELSKNLISPESNPSKEKIEYKSVNEKFFAELEENLRSLRSSKEKAAKGPSPVVGKEVIKESQKNEEPLNEQPPMEKEQELNTLLTDPIKEHSEGNHLFSSRLDEVIEEKAFSNLKPLISEGELLLNYLSFLETHKNSAVKDKKKTEAIIEMFIKKDPSIPYMNAKSLPDEQEDKASQSYRLKGGLLSENMANIYVLQGKKDRAIEIYQQLMLKNPEKRAYFVSQIEKIKGN